MVEAFRENLRRKVRSFRIPSGGMLPSLWVGDHIWVDLVYYEKDNPRKKEVIVFKYPKDETKMFVKRVIGVPGDKILINEKKVYVNGILFEDEGYTQRIDPSVVQFNVSPRDFFGPVVVPPDSYFVLGDNRDQSLDSRFWGFVSKDKILGRAEIIYFSMDKTTNEIHWERGWQKIK